MTSRNCGECQQASQRAGRALWGQAGRACGRADQDLRVGRETGENGQRCSRRPGRWGRAEQGSFFLEPTDGGQRGRVSLERQDTHRQADRGGSHAVSGGLVSAGTRVKCLMWSWGPEGPKGAVSLLHTDLHLPSFCAGGQRPVCKSSL